MTHSSCQVIHHYILRGACPSCGSFIVNGAIDETKSSSLSEALASCVWDYAALSADLPSKPNKDITTVLLRVSLRGGGIIDLLPLLRKLIAHSDRGIQMTITNILMTRASDLTSDEAEQCEKIVQGIPHDTVIHILLLCYYSIPRASFYKPPHASRQEHILWLLDNALHLVSLLPQCLCFSNSAEDVEAYRSAKIRLTALIPEKENDARALEGIAYFLGLQDPETSEGVLVKGKRKEPNNPYWPGRLGFLYHLHMYRVRNRENYIECAKKSLSEYELALSLETRESARFDLLLEIAQLPFEAGEIEKARMYANLLLLTASQSNTPKYKAGNGVHHGHLVMGRISLRLGDKEKAKWHLLQAGNVVCTPDLQTEGPNMKLAKELLDVNERAVVIQYLKKCANFWQSKNHQAEQWIYIIENGGIPDFRPNLGPSMPS